MANRALLVDPRITAENQAICESVGDLTMAWARIENTMAILLIAITRDETDQIAPAIYFSPASIDVRVRLVDAALKQYVKSTIMEQHFKDRLLAVWGSCLVVLNRLRKTRNKVAHGQIAVFGSHQGRPPFARLTTPALQPNEAQIETYLKGKKPGMGSNEIRGSVKAVDALNARLWPITLCIRALNEDDISTFQ
jgi:hypothetical protein